MAQRGLLTPTRKTQSGFREAQAPKCADRQARPFGPILLAARRGRQASTALASLSKRRSLGMGRSPPHHQWQGMPGELAQDGQALELQYSAAAR